MPNPPYSGGVLVITENQDGFTVKVVHWDEVIQDDGTGHDIPPAPAGLIQALLRSVPNPTFYRGRNCATRTTLKAALAQYVDAKFPDSAA